MEDNVIRELAKLRQKKREKMKGLSDARRSKDPKRLAKLQNEILDLDRRIAELLNS